MSLTSAYFYSLAWRVRQYRNVYLAVGAFSSAFAVMTAFTGSGGDRESVNSEKK